ncbi:MAG TPA: right-handed parallel beta-helix repeat-containing protein, partial [Polyangiaceae bacterium]|nr:right-handed parallel beta-helix repeat-containing protein [Polyangiaceae bacterium]
GLEIANVPVGKSGDHSISAVRSEGASNNTYELLDIHHNFGSGLFISKGAGGNQILNCDSHDNYDKDGSQGDGQNADGFGVHYQESGPSTVLRGCRAWLNSDDGYDLISQEVPVQIEGCWAVKNGYADGGSTLPGSGNGNGFKAGSSTTGVRHLLQNDVAWKNRAAGFYANHSSGGNTWLNNTSYMNSVQYNMLASSPDDTSVTIILMGDKVHKMRNNVGFPNKNTNMSGVDSMFNTWDLSISETASDFASTVDTGFDGPRQADGSLPAIDFMQLKAGSPLIDKGTDVGLPAVGAPDLGAYEFGAVKPSGGAAGTPGGGAAGAGGSSDGTAGSAAGSSAAQGGSGTRPNGGTPSGGAASSGSEAGGAASGAASSTAGVAGTKTATAGASATADASASGDDTSTDAGCGCRLAKPASHDALGFVLLGALALLRSTRRRGAIAHASSDHE